MLRNRRLKGAERTDSRLQLRLEPLEQRLLLDGNVLVNVVGNDVFIFGDDLSNDITVAMTATDLVVTPNGTTTVNGGAAPINVARPVLNLTMVMNAGDDVVLVDNVAIGGNLSFDGDGGSDQFGILDSGIGGSLNVSGGLGDDDVTIDNIGVAGNVTLSMGAGLDQALMLSSGVGGSLSAASSHNVLDFGLGDTGVRGNVSVDAGNGSLDGVVDNVGVGGSLSAEARNFMDLAVSDVGVRNNVSVMAGRFDTQVLIGLSGIGGNLTVETQAALPGETPLLDFLVDDVGLRGSLYASAGPGFAGQMLVLDLRARGGVDLMWQDLDGAQAATGFGNSIVGGDVCISGLNGEFDAELDEVASGGLIGLHGNFLTEVDAEDLFARGSFQVDFGPGLLELDLDDGVFRGGMNIQGAGGVEFMEIDDVFMRGDANINVGDGSVQAFLGGSLIGGNLNITNGAGLLADYEVFQTVVRGNLNVNSNAVATDLGLVVAVGGNVDVQTGLGADDIFMEDSGVRGRTTIRSDGGNDDIGLANSLLNGNVLIESGAGEDEVSLAGPFADEFGSPLTFNSNVTVRTGSESDLLEVGGPGGTGETAVFNGSVLFDGGAGIDFLTVFPVNTFTQVPTVTSFEIFP